MQIWNLIEYLCKFKNLNRLFDILTLYFIYYFIFKFSIMGQTFTIPGLIKYKDQSKRRREKGPHRNFNEEKGIRERIIRQKSYRGTPRIFRVISTCGLSSSFQWFQVGGYLREWSSSRTGGRRWKGAPDGFRTTEVCGIVSIWLDILESRSTLPQPCQDLEICFLCAPSCGGCSHASDKNITPSKSMVNFFDSG